MFLILLAAIHIVGLLIVLIAVAKAPFGYEDEKGFHKNETGVPTPSHPSV